MMLLIVLAQAAAAVAAPEQGVISYPPAFFAAQQPGNAFEMVQRLPGFTLDTGDNVRGFEGGGGNALIDGKRPASKTDNLSEILRRIPASRVARIDLIRGGASGIDMQGQTVIANIVQTSHGGLTGVLQAQNTWLHDGRNLPQLRLELAGGDGERKWEASARFSKIGEDAVGDGPNLRVRPDGEALRRSDVQGESDAVQGTLTGAYQAPVLGGVARMNARYYRDKWKMEERNRFSLPAGFGAEFIDEVWHARDMELGGRFNRDLGPQTNLELLGLSQTQRRSVRSDFATPVEKTGFDLDRESSERIARAVVKHAASPTLGLEAGVEGAFNTLASSSALTIDDMATPLPAANVEVEERRGELFARGSWRPSERFTLDAGLRYERSSISSSGDLGLEKSLQYAKPRVAAAWSPWAATQLRASFERTIGQLAFADFVAAANFNSGAGVTAGNPDLTPEQAWVSEAAMEQRFWGDAVLVATLRHSAISDVNDRGPVRIVREDGSVTVFDQPMNIGDGWKRELIASLTLPFAAVGLRGATLRAEGSWRSSEVTDPTTGEKREISNLEALEWTLNFTHDLPQWRLSYGAEVMSAERRISYRYNAIQEQREGVYVKPFAEWRVQPDISIRVEIPNLLERGTRYTRRQYAGPRDANGLSYVDDRDLTYGRAVLLRIRKTLG
jgi:outer membrane receptor protein involved in Fe transport